MGHRSSLKSALIPSFGVGLVDRHPSFSLFFFTIYHLFPCFMLTLEIISNMKCLGSQTTPNLWKRVEGGVSIDGM